MSTYVIPFVIGMLLARDLIVGILIPSSISLPASLFTRSVVHFYLLSLRWFSLEGERVMQQSSVSMSLSFENQGINPVGDNVQVTEYLHKQ